MKKILIFTLCITSFLSCKKQSDTYDGANIAESYSSFTVLEPFKADKDSVDFAAGEKVQFTAKFNKTVSWKITITGETSHAQKIFTDTSKVIDITNGLWNGSTSVFPMFRAEKCNAQLTIVDVVDTFTVAVKIRTIKTNSGLVIADFENGFNPAWTKFVQSGANMDFAIKTDALVPQAAKYLRMAGTVNWDYLIGLIDFPATAYGGANTLPLASNPDNVYFNCLIYGDTSAQNESLVLFQIKEDENANGTFEANNEDEYDYQITVNWVGWKLVTIRYSDIQTLVNGQPATPKGNGQHNPDKIGKISMLDLANPANGFASTRIDYIIFTSSPLEP